MGIIGTATLLSVLCCCCIITTAQSTIGAVSCSPTLTASYPTPSVADGYVARLVANDLSDPRGLLFDTRGNLLVVEQQVGITALTLADAGGGCLSVASRRTVIADDTLNHGIQLSEDGATLYASNSDSVYRWAYDVRTAANTSGPVTLVTNMTNSDHTTRTLLLSQQVPGMLLVSRGSSENYDADASSLSSGHSQIKAFNITNLTSDSEPYNFATDGILLGWGLRNDVGMAEEPIAGGIYAVENSADQMERQGQDIHEDNPGEELNFLGYLNESISNVSLNEYPYNGAPNYGYPECFAAWDVSIPDFDGEVGQQFAIGDLDSTNNDSMCASPMRTPPRLTFEAHMAPLDILFNSDGTAAWVTFHGSWNRDEPSGYKLSVVPFHNGEPVDPSNSTTAAHDVMTNEDNSRCPDECFRPAGLAWDSQGRLFMTSDATGEIYAILRADGNSTQNVGTNSTGTIPGYTAPGTGAGTNTSDTTTSSTAAAASATGCHALAAGVGILALLL